ncbi:hypothetical protein HDU97_007512 [Phlyctochytrium planicorne]|nr:hypothetical protein HDU97_007512 [Phlyctochytrium planicorne]
MIHLRVILLYSGESTRVEVDERLTKEELVDEVGRRFGTRRDCIDLYKVKTRSGKDASTVPIRTSSLMVGGIKPTAIGGGLEDMLKKHVKSDPEAVDPTSTHLKLLKECLEPLDDQHSSRVTERRRSIGELLGVHMWSSQKYDQTHLVAMVKSPSIQEPATANRKPSSPLESLCHLTNVQEHTMARLEGRSRSSTRSGGTTLPRLPHPSWMDNWEVEPMPTRDADQTSQYHPAKDSLGSTESGESPQPSSSSSRKSKETWSEGFDPLVLASHASWVQPFHMPMAPPTAYSAAYQAPHHGYSQGFPTSASAHFDASVYYPNHSTYPTTYTQPFQLPNPHPHILTNSFANSSSGYNIERHSISSPTLHSQRSYSIRGAVPLPPIPDVQTQKSRRRVSLVPSLFKPLSASEEEERDDIRRLQRCKLNHVNKSHVFNNHVLANFHNVGVIHVSFNNTTYIVCCLELYHRSDPDHSRKLYVNSLYY